MTRARESEPTVVSKVETRTDLRWSRKDLLGLRELSTDEINFVLDTADAFKQVGTREIKKVPALRGKTLVNFFVEPSTRTRTSFELAAFRLSADVINISAATSSLTKGETLKDTAKNLEALRAAISGRAIAVQRDQCWGWRTRTSHPGFARSLHHSRKKGPRGWIARGDCWRHSV